MKYLQTILACGLLLAGMPAQAQVTERERPEEWKNLVTGGRFADRFEAMPQGQLSDKNWGCADVQPRYVDNGIEREDLSFWGGNILKGDDGRYHLFVCGWKENSPRGHMFWSKSTVFHTVADKPYGPYHIVNSIGKGHNPEAFRLTDGRYVVYVIDGCYIADRLEGPWLYSRFSFDPRDRRIIEGLSNLSFASRPDNSKLMVCRGGGIWVSRDGLSPYQQLTDKRVYPAVEGEFEDPVIWRDELQYHLIVNDWLGRVAFYERSLDGLHWVVEDGEAYVPGISRHADGKVENWFKYERPKVLQDEYGRVTQMNFAVIDTIKWEDLPNDRHSSKNICIPMNRGLRMEVRNTAPIGPKTKKIELLIKGDADGRPLADLDFASLRFGTHSEVNYGRGAKAVKAVPQGNDLLVTFQGKDSGITDEEFAPKLIGAYKDGQLAFGYARLPYLNYKPALLSARLPVAQDGGMAVEVQNFGLSASEPCTVSVTLNGQLLGRTEVRVLQPYEAVTCSVPSVTYRPQEKDVVEVCFERAGNVFERNTLVVEPKQEKK
ncbi:MAG: glycoside hydrolase family protein [Bacteroidales bacterium]|nr:glycoside hydrolase family protein [Bacteroidales bacterium]